MGSVQRRVLKGVMAVVLRPRTTLLVAGIILVGCVALALTKLTISSDQNRLFSPDDPNFKRYLDFIDKFGENEAIYIVIEPRQPGIQPPITRWTACADAVTDHLRQLTQYVAAAHCRVPLEQLGKQGVLFEDPAKLPADFRHAATQLIPLAQLWGGRQSFATRLLGPTPIERILTGAVAQVDDQSADFLTHLVDSWSNAITHPDAPLNIGDGVFDLKRYGAKSPEDLGYMYVPNQQDPNQHRILVAVYKKQLFNSLTAVTREVKAIRKTAEDAGKPFPEFQIGVTGRPALEADQMETTDQDSHRAETVALITVFIGMALMLRSIWLALAAEITLGIAIGWTFGWATVTVGQLNLLSVVFLIALIGIGMDYLVQILSRYRMEARVSERATVIWVRVFRYVGPPINTACAGAAGAFLVSVFTKFRGAAELGVIAGGGLLLCLLAGYVVLPALLTIFPPRLKPLAASQRRPGKGPSSGVKRLILPAIWILLLAGGLRYESTVHFDENLIGLQAGNLESAKLIDTLQTWMAVVLSKDLNQLRAARSVVVKLPEVQSTDSILGAYDNAAWLTEHAAQMPSIDWTPLGPITASQFPRIALKARTLARDFAPATGPSTAAVGDERRAAAVALDRFAALLEAQRGESTTLAAARLTEWQNVFDRELQDLIEQFRPQQVDVAALPPELRDHYVSADGTYALYIIPRDNLWNGQKLEQFETSVEAAMERVPGHPDVTGITSNVYHTTTAIHHAFYQATIYALILIFILVWLDFRRIGPTLAAISVLALGLPMMIAIMGRFNVNWNFANFFGLPILIGAGHEYGVFMVHRFHEACRHPRRVWRRWDVSDKALLLCAFITSTSFGFFWIFAHHRGLRSLGMVMAIGTACIYLATLMVLRPLLRWDLEKRKARGEYCGPEA